MNRENKTRNIREVKKKTKSTAKRIEVLADGTKSLWDNFKPYKSSMEDGTFEETYKGMILDRLVMMDCRLDKINEQLEALRGKEAEVIDLDKAVTDSTNGIGLEKLEKHHQNILDGVDDSKEETPKIGERYSCLRSDGSTNYFEWQDGVYDRARWNEGNCKRMGVDDSEEVEFTKEELQEIKQLAESECNKCFGVNYMGEFRDLYDRIYYKANKMLKEKE